MASQLQECGFTRGIAFPSVYLNEADDVAVMVHGDDYFCTGPTDALEKLRGNLAKSFKIKSSMLGAEKGMETEGKILNILVWKQTRGMQSSSSKNPGCRAKV